MKPAAFEYVAPTSRAEALAALARAGDEARILAGGQSLVPAMNFRLARPAVLVDVNRAAELDYVAEAEGRLRIGALARHAAFERPVTDGPLGALLARIARHVAHPPIRTRGTMAGSIANADPAAEWCVAALALDAELVLESAARGARTVPARDFFLDLFETALAEDEMLVEVRLPKLGPDRRCGFAEFSRRAGDYALAMALAVLRIDGGTVRAARIVVGSVGPTPLALPEAAAALEGRAADADAIALAARLAAEAVDPPDDVQASAAYRRDLVAAMVARALKDATTA